MTLPPPARWVADFYATPLEIALNATLSAVHLPWVSVRAGLQPLAQP
jgi:hypothetical protein